MKHTRLLATNHRVSWLNVECQECIYSWNIFINIKSSLSKCPNSWSCEWVGQIFWCLLAPHDILDPVGIQMYFGVHTGQSLDTADQSIGGDANHLLQARIYGMLHEDRTAGVAITSIRTGVPRSRTQLGAHIDLVLQSLAALGHIVSIETHLEQMRRGVSTLRGGAPSGGCHLQLLISAIERQAGRSPPLPAPPRQCRSCDCPYHHPRRKPDAPHSWAPGNPAAGHHPWCYCSPVRPIWPRTWGHHSWDPDAAPWSWG